MGLPQGAPPPIVRIQPAQFRELLRAVRGTSGPRGSAQLTVTVRFACPSAGQTELMNRHTGLVAGRPTDVSTPRLGPTGDNMELEHVMRISSVPQASMHPLRISS